jgi:glutathione S-transferase
MIPGAEERVSIFGVHLMELFFQPMACSLATRIALYEAGIPATFVRVNLTEKKTADGRDFLAINGRGQVPALKIDDGEVLTENIAVLEYVADIRPEAGLAPQGRDRVRLRKWLGLINSELHTAALEPVLSTTNPAPAEAKAYLLERGRKAMEYIDAALAGRDWLTDSYSIADMYLAVVVSWLQSPKMKEAKQPILLANYPNIQAHNKRVFSRPAAGKALGEELALYRAA